MSEKNTVQNEQSLAEENAALRSEVSVLKEELAELQQQMAWLKKQMFGRKTEQTSAIMDGGTRLSASGAQVKVYFGSSTLPVEEFSVPPGTGNIWKVFTYDS